jgi:hypothetical protein
MQNQRPDLSSELGLFLNDTSNEKEKVNFLNPNSTLDPKHANLLQYNVDLVKRSKVLPEDVEKGVCNDSIDAVDETSRAGVIEAEEVKLTVHSTEIPSAGKIEARECNSGGKKNKKAEVEKGETPCNSTCSSEEKKTSINATEEREEEDGSEDLYASDEGCIRMDGPHVSIQLCPQNCFFSTNVANIGSLDVFVGHVSPHEVPRVGSFATDLALKSSTSLERDLSCAVASTESDKEIKVSPDSAKVEEKCPGADNLEAREDNFSGNPDSSYAGNFEAEEGDTGGTTEAAVKGTFVDSTVEEQTISGKDRDAVEGNGNVNSHASPGHGQFSTLRTSVKHSSEVLAGHVICHEVPGGGSFITDLTAEPSSPPTTATSTSGSTTQTTPSLASPGGGSLALAAGSLQPRRLWTFPDPRRVWLIAWYALTQYALANDNLLGYITTTFALSAFIYDTFSYAFEFDAYL